ncbi:MAG: cyclase family protein [Candidatus Dependentiae bacterium]
MEKIIVDLTHTLHSSVPTWTGSCGFASKIKLDYDQGCRVQDIKMHAGIGTHIDAPAHFFSGAMEVEDISLSQLIAPLLVVDVRHKVNNNYDYVVSSKDIQAFEQKFGKIDAESLVVFHTGWSDRWHDAQLYRNCDAKSRMHFPSVSADVGDILLQRDVAGMGIDTLSPDCSTALFPVHEKLLGANKYIVENVANLQNIDQIGFVAYVLPIKANNLVEAPVRFIAIKRNADV